MMNHLFGYEATLQTPQVFPVASLMNPLSPHDPPHEFLILHEPATVPTKRTPWLRDVLQLLKTPLLYGDQLVASTATETGLPVRALAKSLQFLISVKPEILNAPPCLEQVCFTAL
jgi:hypothetical protein